ncbi:MAG: SDR family NAD(P)-dependent oxidoreductase [Sphaerochaetaceae bacterium]|nr:SDR family NAD(P)-dependent oxidoreductase [Sphaerochaetaceae bacterium]
MERKVVLVTGGSKGIGREIARMYVQRGDIVFICGRNRESLEHAVHAIDPEGTRLFGIQADISDAPSCERVVAEIANAQGRLDILINNAGMAMRGTVLETSFEVMDAMVRINMLGSAYMTRSALPLLIASRGSVTFVSSLAALHGLPRIALYAASKGALTAFCQSLRAEVAPAGVHVGIVHVGFTENDPDKVVYAANGSLVPLAGRRNSQTQQETAKAIIRAVDRRKNVVVLTLLGKLAAFAYRGFPRLADWMICTFAAKSRQYAENGN